MVDDENLKITEINIMFLGQGENEFKGIISDLGDFLTDFSLKMQDFYDDKFKATSQGTKKQEKVVR